MWSLIRLDTLLLPSSPCLTPILQDLYKINILDL